MFGFYFFLLGAAFLQRIFDVFLFYFIFLSDLESHLIPPTLPSRRWFIRRRPHPTHGFLPLL